jgi:hypothetical protein
MKHGTSVKDKAKGVRNLMKMAMTIGLANAGVEQTKNWVRGKDNIAMTDAMFVNLLRNWGISQYTLSDLKSGNFADGIMSLAKPPVGPIEDVYKYIARDDYPESKLIRNIPVVGKPISWWLEGTEGKDDLTMDFGNEFKLDYGLEE